MANDPFSTYLSEINKAYSCGDTTEHTQRLGITAPKNIPVHRREVYEAIQREKSEKKKNG